MGAMAAELEAAREAMEGLLAEAEAVRAEVSRWQEIVSGKVGDAVAAHAIPLRARAVRDCLQRAARSALESQDLADQLIAALADSEAYLWQAAALEKARS